jgi:serine/threonine protein kinase/tetratricopeptide (TPR) repeat protein
VNDPCLHIMALLAEGLPSRYRVVRYIAQGGMGCVFEGVDGHLDQRVAFKVLKADIASAVTAGRFKREGPVLAKLNHTNIVRVFDSLETSNGLLVIVMEYVDGPTLQEVLKKRRLTSDEAVSIGTQLLHALQHAHSLKIIHRDIKPGNIFLRGDTALLGDFGIASFDGLGTSTLTEDGKHPGTLLYMPVEQAQGRVTPRSDIFSMGLVLRLCFTGIPEDTVRVPSVDAWRGVRFSFKRVVERATNEGSEKRWPSAKSFRSALQSAADPMLTWWRAFLVGILVLGVGLALWPLVRDFLCRHTRWQVGCPAPPLPSDLAILPFTAEASHEEGARISRLVGKEIEPFPVIKLLNPARTAAWWDSLSPAQRETAIPAGARYYVTGSVSQEGSRLEADIEVHDSTGARFTRLRATGDTAHQPFLARTIAESVVCAVFAPDCEDFRSLLFRPGDDRAIAEFFKGKDSVAKGNWAAGERHFEEALRRDPGFMVAAWELMIARRIQRKDFSEDLQLIARNIDSLPDFYHRLATASLTPDLRTRFRLFEEAVQSSRGNGTAQLLYTNELFHRGALVGRPLEATVDTLTALAGTEPEMNHSSTYDMAWWGELRIGRERQAWDDLARRKALGPPPGDRYPPFQRLGTYARFSPWKANLARFLLLRNPSESELKSLTDFARLGNLMDIPEEQLALGEILSNKGTKVPQRAAGKIGLAGAHLMLGRPTAAQSELDLAAGTLKTSEMKLQQREWPVHLASLNLYFDTLQVDSARAWLASAPLQGNERVRALYALGRDAAARRDTTRLMSLEADLRDSSRASPSSLRHADLLHAELLAARGDTAGALQASTVIYIRDTTLVRLSPFARATTYLNRGAWQQGLGQPDSADAAWLWYESSDFEGWPTGAPQEGELDAILGVYGRLLRGELEAARGNGQLACRHLRRVLEFWKDAEPGMSSLRARASNAWKDAGCR